ncbi:MAG TPA: hypothetical protein VGU64_00485 [Terriglobales bacterium]|nr:hypothetical protein [Terriglobales bacterium]
MSWKRLLVSAVLGFFIMVADGLLLIVVNRLYLPAHPPHWMIGVIFYFDAWPVLITQHIFLGAGTGGPTFLAVASGALIDWAIFTAIAYGVLSRRARRKARV